MSTETRVTVACDEPGCGLYFTFNRRDEGGLNSSYALDYAKRKGWSIRGHHALCVTHRRHPQKKHAFVPGRSRDMCYATIGGHSCWRSLSDAVHAL